MKVRAEVEAVLAQPVKVTRLAYLAFTRDGELQLALTREICERFVQAVHMRQHFYRLVVTMMLGIIRNMVGKILRADPEYTFDSQTMDLYLAPEPTFSILVAYGSSI